MDYVVIGGDERMARLAALLSARGRAVCAPDRDALPEALRGARNVLIGGWPKSAGKRLESALPNAAPDARLWLCAPGLSRLKDDPRAIDLWQDEDLLVENAWLTAEGAVSAAMRASGAALRGMRCMVVGWGRVGLGLTELLTGLGARVTVASRSLAHCHRAVQRGAEAVAADRLSCALPAMRLVFNTAPAMTLDAENLKCAAKNTMIVDLASPPWGVDLRAAWAMGLRAWREPGLPGRYCPESAARALLNAMDRRGEHG